MKSSQRRSSVPQSKCTGYKGINLDCGYRVDVIVENEVVLELKCVEHILPIHEAQLLTYLKLLNRQVGLILNFYISTLTRGGIVRKVK
jgi:GxxExxY protein